MPGIASVILTHKEIGALLEAAPNTGVKVNADIWANLRPKLEDALGPIACPVPAREEKS